MMGPDGKTLIPAYPTMVVENGWNPVLTTEDKTGEGKFTFTEPFYLSPFSGDSDDVDFGGFVRLDKILVQVGFGTLENLLSLHEYKRGDAKQQIEYKNVTVTPTDVSIQLQYLASPANYVLPQVIKTRFYSIAPLAQIYNQTAKVNSGSPATLTVGNYSMVTIPRRIYAWIGINPNYSSAEQPSYQNTDSALPLQPLGVNKIVLRLGNMDKLAQITTEQLYSISRRNGYAYRYTDFVSEMGSVVCFDVARDFGLFPYQVPGLVEKVNLSIQMTAINNRSLALEGVTMFVLPVEEGVTVDNGGNRQTMIGLYSKEQVLENQDFGGFLGGRFSTSIEGLSYSPNAYGGSFWDVVKKGANWFKGKDVLSNLAKNILPEGQLRKDTMTLLQNQGLGLDPSMGGKSARKPRTKKISQEQVRKALQSIVSK
jgi:hypothetical protein